MFAYVLLYIAFVCCIGGISCLKTDPYLMELIHDTGKASSGKESPFSSYPQCARDCLRSVSAGYPANCPNQPNPACECSPTSRSNVSSCYVLTCSDVDFSSAENLDAERCNPVYSTTSSLPLAVASAISSATVAAQAALATRDPTKLQDLPVCAQHCVLPGLAAGGCSGEADRECACRCPAVQNVIGPCYLSSCGFEDLQVLSYISKSLCGPVGGQEPKVESACGYSSNHTASSLNPVNATTSRPTSSSVNTLNSTSAPFTGSTISTRMWAAGPLNAVVVVLMIALLVT